MEGGGEDGDAEHGLHPAHQVREEGEQTNQNNHGLVKSFDLLIWKFEKLLHVPQPNKTHSSSTAFSLPICHFTSMTSEHSESKSSYKYLIHIG